MNSSGCCPTYKFLYQRFLVFNVIEDWGGLAETIHWTCYQWLPLTGLFKMLAYKDYERHGNQSFHFSRHFFFVITLCLSPVFWIPTISESRRQMYAYSEKMWLVSFVCMNDRRLYISDWKKDQKKKKTFNPFVPAARQSRRGFTLWILIILTFQISHCYQRKECHNKYRWNEDQGTNLHLINLSPYLTTFFSWLQTSIFMQFLCTISLRIVAFYQFCRTLG